MIANWRRPYNPNFHTNVFSYFTGQNAEQFVINVLSTAEAKEQALDLIMQELFEVHPIMSALDFDPVSKKFLRNWIAMYLDQNVSLGCYTRTEGTLVAVDNLYVRNISDTFPEFTETSIQSQRNFLEIGLRCTLIRTSHWVATRAQKALWLQSIICMFEISVIHSRSSPKFVINVLSTAEAKEQALDLIMQELFEVHPIMSALDFDPVSKKFLRNWIAMYLDQNVSLGCYTRTEGTLVPVDNLYVRNISDTFPEFTEDPGEAFKSFIKYTRVIERELRYMSGQIVCNYLTSSGVFLSPAYRNIGITNEMIRMRLCVARSLRIEVIGSAFIGNEMQQAAKKYKYRVLKTFRPQAMIDLGLDFRYEIFPIEIWVKTHKNTKLEEIVENDVTSTPPHAN